MAPSPSPAPPPPPLCTSSLLEVPHLARQHNLAYTTNNFTSLKHLYFQTVRARDMKFLDNDHHPLCVRCHMSCVTCHVSNVMCNLSTVTCHLSRVTCHHYLQSVRARDLQFWDNAHHPLCVRCHRSCVMCHVARVTCHMSHFSFYVSRVPWHHKLQTVRARDLTFWDNFHHPLCVMCHMSSITCNMSFVPCHMSHVICHPMSHVTYQVSFVTWHHYS